jgi:hypothetical protein
VELGIRGSGWEQGRCTHERCGTCVFWDNADSAAGREFGWNDLESTGLKAIVKKAAVKAFFPGENLMGRSIQHKKKIYEIVGVVDDAKI